MLGLPGYQVQHLPASPMQELNPQPPSETRTARRLPPLSLKVNFAWSFLSNALVAVCQLGLIALLLKAGDATSGQYILALSISAPVFMLPDSIYERCRQPTALQKFDSSST